jgi:hypothetical protein
MKPCSAGRKPVPYLVVVMAATIGSAGCGGGDSEEQQAKQGGPQLAQPINLANCEDWKAGTVDERVGTVRGIRDFLGTPVPGAGSSREPLDDEEAYELLDGWCGNEFARGFRLYKLYARAQAFAGAAKPSAP